MGQQHSIRQPRGIRSNPLANENYNRLVYPNPSVTEKQQVEYIKNRVLTKYDEPVIIGGETVEYYIPKGTKLYHSSLDFYQTFDEDRITFFGIDIIISLWYIVEMNNKKYKRFGVIYEFDVIKDIPVYILESIGDHPYNTYGPGTKCRSKEYACIHPQYAYHKEPNSFGEMSMEVTMNLSNPLFKSSVQRAIHPIHNNEITYVIDINTLEKMAEMGDYTFHQFNPIRPTMNRLTQKQRKNMGNLITYKNETNTTGQIAPVIKGFLSEIIEKANTNNKKEESKGGRWKQRGRTHRKRRA